jgi:hypothetical protein
LVAAAIAFVAEALAGDGLAVPFAMTALADVGLPGPAFADAGFAAGLVVVLTGATFTAALTDATLTAALTGAALGATRDWLALALATAAVLIGAAFDAEALALAAAGAGAGLAAVVVRAGAFAPARFFSRVGVLAWATIRILLEPGRPASLTDE